MPLFSGWPEGWDKITQILEKVAKTVANFKNTKIASSELNLKVQNILINPLKYLQQTIFSAENHLGLLKVAKWQNFTQSGHPVAFLKSIEVNYSYYFYCLKNSACTPILDSWISFSPSTKELLARELLPPSK
jgi:hypothetical protein